MTINIYFPLAIFMIAVFGSRWLSNKANEELPNSKKAELFEVFGNRSMISSIVPAAIIFIILIVGYYYDLLDHFWFLLVALGAVFGSLIFSTIYTQSKLRKANFDQAYCRKLLLASAVRTGGIIICFGMLIFNRM